MVNNDVPEEVGLFLGAYMDVVGGVARAWNITDPKFVDDALELLANTEIVYQSPQDRQACAYMYQRSADNPLGIIKSYPLTPVQTFIDRQSTEDVLRTCKFRELDSKDHDTIIGLFMIIFSFTDACWSLFLKHAIDTKCIAYNDGGSTPDVVQYSLLKESRTEFYARASIYINTAVLNFTNQIKLERYIHVGSSNTWTIPMMRYGIFDINLPISVAHNVGIHIGNTNSIIVSPGPVLVNIALMTDNDEYSLGD